jgi:hypothetical protein
LLSMTLARRTGRRGTRLRRLRRSRRHLRVSQPDLASGVPVVLLFIMSHTTSMLFILPSLFSLRGSIYPYIVLLCTLVMLSCDVGCLEPSCLNSVLSYGSVMYYACASCFCLLSDVMCFVLLPVVARSYGQFNPSL